MSTLVDCPTCGRKTEFDRSNPWRPFCSQRCKTVDLGAWASGKYVIPGNEVEPEEAGDDDPGEGTFAPRPPRAE